MLAPPAIVTALALLLSAINLRADLREANAIRAIEELGGAVMRDEKTAGEPVVAVELRGAAVTDDSLKLLFAFPKLRSLDLGHSRVTNAGLKHLACLPSLSDLDLRDTKVTDAGLPILSGMAELRGLHLGDNAISDDGLRHLAALKRLGALNLVNTRVTELGIIELRKSLPDCGISAD